MPALSRFRTNRDAGPIRAGGHHDAEERDFGGAGFRFGGKGPTNSSGAACSGAAERTSARNRGSARRMRTSRRDGDVLMERSLICRVGRFPDECLVGLPAGCVGDEPSRLYSPGSTTSACLRPAHRCQSIRRLRLFFPLAFHIDP